MTEQEIFVYSNEFSEAVKAKDSVATQDVIGKILNTYSNDLSKIAISKETEPFLIFTLREFLKTVEDNAEEHSLVLADKLQNNFDKEINIAY